MDELKSLAITIDCTIVEQLIIPIRTYNAATLIGKGKVEELTELIEEKEIDFVIFESDLKPRVQRNLENIFDVAVIDRQEVILQIFSDRAATKEAVLQVALARQQYSLPRLERKWTHLSRQRGGMRGTRDAGETQLEIDRRLVLTKIANLKKELAKVVGQREIQRKSRVETSIATAAIVGYTNAGKSSLLNLLSESDVFVENKLFATLDPTTRKISLPKGSSLLITDTVGFVSNLPHQLVEAFKSTLEEAVYADIIIHVVDAAHPDMLQCYETTKEVLQSLDSLDKPTALFINKSDAIYDMDSLNQIVSENPNAIVGSVRKNKNIDKLLDEIENLIALDYVDLKFLFPHSKGDLVALLRKEGLITTIDYVDNGTYIEAKVPPHLRAKLERYMV